MKSFEESFVPSLNNVTSIIQLEWFCFVFKDSQQSIQFKYFNTVKKRRKKKKEPKLGRQSFSVLNTNIQLIKDLLCVCWCMCIKYSQAELLKADICSPSPILRGRGLIRKDVFSYSFKVPSPYLYSVVWLKESGTLLSTAHKIIRVPSPSFT